MDSRQRLAKKIYGEKSMQYFQIFAEQNQFEE